MSRKRQRRGRPVSGILLLDKPAGTSSNAALQEVKRLYRAQKAGHTGSLDVPASGLLPICLGEATKMSGFLLDSSKRYRSKFELGIRTSTGDALGEVLERREVPALSESRIRSVLATFLGELEQIPPMHSAIKHAGQPLYKLAYQGKTVERQPRCVNIYAFELLGVSGSVLEVDIHCSKGTYIRTLAEEVGNALGCGGHVAALRRTAVGPFELCDAVTIDHIRELAHKDPPALDALLLEPDRAVAEQPEVRLSEDAAYYLCRGQPVLVPKSPSRGLVRAYDARGSFLGIGEILDDGRVAPRRLLKL